MAATKNPDALDCKAIEQAFSAALGAPFRLAAHRHWASVTFDGYRLALLTRETLGSVPLAKIAEWEIPVPGFVVADVEVVPSTGGYVRVDALLVREG